MIQEVIASGATLTLTSKNLSWSRVVIRRVTGGSGGTLAFTLTQDGRPAYAFSYTCADGLATLDLTLSIKGVFSGTVVSTNC